MKSGVIHARCISSVKRIDGKMVLLVVDIYMGYRCSLVWLPPKVFLFFRRADGLFRKRFNDWATLSRIFSCCRQTLSVGAGKAWGQRHQPFWLTRTCRALKKSSWSLQQSNPVVLAGAKGGGCLAPFLYVSWLYRGLRKSIIIQQLEHGILNN